MTRRLSILGATGSVGRSTLAVLRDQPEGSFAISALTANGNVDAMAQLAEEWRPQVIAMADPAAAAELRARVDPSIRVLDGAEGVVAAACHPADLVMAAIVGIAGLAPMMAAAETGADILLANKEGLICAGPLLLQAIAKGGGRLLPVDSEHNAVFQVRETGNLDQLERITLTASGGPFRRLSRDQLADVTPEQAVAHPVWSMGAKISVDSASMVNKALELIEAHLLFDLPEDRLSVLLHPQSIIHGMAHYADGSVLAQLGSPDMRVPIAHALGHPQRLATTAERLDLATVGRLTFEPLDETRFPAVAVAREAIRVGGSLACVINAANEAMVAAFLDRRLPFAAIDSTLQHIAATHQPTAIASLDDVRAADAEGRHLAAALTGL